MEDQNGDIWFSTESKGIIKYSEGEFTQMSQNRGLPSKEVFTIYRDKQNKIWISTSNGIYNWNSDSQTFSRNKKYEDGAIVNQFFEDDGGNFWVGTNNLGLILLDRSTNDYIQYQVREDQKFGINAATIMDIDEDDMGNLLLATEGGGLNVLNLEKISKSQNMM